MILKFINPIYDAPQLVTVRDAFIAHNIDDDGNVQKDYVMVIHCSDIEETAVCLEGLSFSKLNEIMNEFYNNEKVDITSNADVTISVCPRDIIETLEDIRDMNSDGIDLDDDYDFDDLT